MELFREYIKYSYMNGWIQSQEVGKNGCQKIY